ncbi:alanine--tRNA ligase [Aliiglaciecola sp. CAU 1673]|uniref:alanine--tRNA ligase n=1 Tax=Aliiglaciecola sp. CAU 1673 TaxID=3032595 RepID=UPI0023DA43F3|nr:alanine--tRNA ligase [Aliiglaciecola sp. CAU 1673]MDF2178255.1 alanine--tRNA ligase [Aliiglaciecola sp. CAU 1673]
MTISTADIRRAFLDYFAKHGHQVVASSSLVPADDPTLLFTNAGMNQFKDVFLGAEKRAYTRAVSSQRCVRAGGKHNDLENVGYTARHHTFFEMLGNFSFGDYFKQEAIRLAWNFLTEELKLPKEKLLVTVYAEDDEAFDIWEKEIGVPAEKIIRIGTSDNFWSMGDTGPCGPCSEIFYDHGEHIWGGPPGSPEEDGDRFIEIWNLVFMQFNRQADGSMQPLPKPSIDTGMGLERISAILQHVHSNYEIDLFQALIRSAADITGAKDLADKSLRVIADHIRSCSFLIADGVLPSNEGRGYVLRRIIRRAVRHGYKLGANDIFFFRLVAELVKQMGEAYPELKAQQATIERVLKAEEEQFSRTLERGMQILGDALESLEGDTVPGEVVFKLYDTYGFPADLTNDVARERGFKIDQAGFEAAMAEQRKRAQQASQFGTDYNDMLTSEQRSDFTGYEHEQGKAKVVELFSQSAAVNELKAGEQGIVVLDSTPFYAESGGQVGDTGLLRVANGGFLVQDTVKLGSAIAHKGIAQADIKVGDLVDAEIDAKRRQAIKLNHSATHLLHAALKQVLGEHVNQKGSLVDPERLRFDFAHFEAVSKDQLLQIENLVNEQVRANHDLATRLMGLEAAKAAGAQALFGEKYDDEVRVVSMGRFSMELCGGTHVKRTGDIGLFRITSEGGIASGVRRIEAVTGEAALAFSQQQALQLSSLAALVKSDTNSLPDRIAQLLEQSKGLEKELQQLKQKMASQAGSDLLSQASEINGVKCLSAKLEGVESKSLRDLMDTLKNKLGSGILMLAVAEGEKVSLIAGVTKDLTDKVKAGELVNFVAQQVGGKGGGRPDMAQAGGTQPENLDKALASVSTWLQDKL